MKTLAKLLGFQNDTFLDHNGKPSTGRKAIVSCIAAMILLIFACMSVAAGIDPKQSAAMLPFYGPALTALGAVISLGFGAVYYSKGKAESVTAKTTTATATSSKAPDKPTPATTAPATTTVTAKTTTATATSTREPTS